MRDPQAGEPDPSSRGNTDEYQSYVIRVRSRPTGSSAMAANALSIRVEHVNERTVRYFTKLSRAFDFVAHTVRRVFRHADP